MVRTIGEYVICGNCGGSMSKEAGYYLCPDCSWRFYGEPNVNPCRDTPCDNCGWHYLKCQHRCPVCGVSAGG